MNNTEYKPFLINSLMYVLCPHYFSAILAHCPVLMNLTNGVVMVTGNSLGNIATYRCDPNYELVGTSILVCGDNRQWSAEPPMCIRKYY